jgi:hypothetical protein
MRGVRGNLLSSQVARDHQICLWLRWQMAILHRIVIVLASPSPIVGVMIIASQRSNDIHSR